MQNWNWNWDWTAARPITEWKYQWSIRRAVSTRGIAVSADQYQRLNSHQQCRERRPGPPDEHRFRDHVRAAHDQIEASAAPLIGGMTCVQCRTGASRSAQPCRWWSRCRPRLPAPLDRAGAAARARVPRAIGSGALLPAHAAAREPICRLPRRSGPPPRRCPTPHRVISPLGPVQAFGRGHAPPHAGIRRGRTEGAAAGGSPRGRFAPAPRQARGREAELAVGPSGFAPLNAPDGRSAISCCSS